MSTNTFSPRRALGSAAIIAAVTVFSVVVPVSAANAGPAGTIADLQTQLNLGGTVQLTADISAPASLLSVPVDATLDLNGFDLTTNSTTIGAGATLTAVDTATGGLWTAEVVNNFDSQPPGIRTTDATLIVNGASITAIGGYTAAGIGGNEEYPGGTVVINSGTVTASNFTQGAGIGGGWGADGGDITVNGGTVNATGGYYAAGIGGGYHGSAGTITITGGTVVATGGGGGAGAAGIGGGVIGSGGAISITGGTVTATGTTRAAGIGAGGDGATGGTVEIGAGAVVTAQNGGTGTVVGGGSNGTFDGLTVAGTLTVPSGNFLGILAGVTATIASTGVVTGGGDLRGAGAIVNNGIILNSTVANLADGTGLDITMRDYRVAFDGNFAGAASTSVRVYAPTFDTGNRIFPAAPTRSGGYTFDGWNTAADGSGVTPTESTTLASDTTYFAQWASVYVLTPASQTVTAGDSVQFLINGTPGGGDSTFVSSNDADTVTGDVVNFTEAGVRTITATLDSDPTVTRTATITVDAAAAATVTMTASDLTVTRGDTITLGIVVKDAYGNVLPNTSVVVTSSYTTDIIVGDRVTFPTASVHIITARLGGLSAQLSVTVSPAALPSTGTDPAAPLGAAALLLLLGVAAVVFQRRVSLR